MRIVHLSTSDSAGGAARAAYRLHVGLRRLGHESRMLVLRKVTADPDVIAIKPRNGYFDRMARRRTNRRVHREMKQYTVVPSAGYEVFSDDRTPYGREILEQLPPCDVVNLHFVGGFLDWTSFFTALPERIPVVWRLADMGAFTGGCHYDGGCGKFAHQCGACPQLGSENPQDLSRQIWMRKTASLKAMPHRRLHLAGPSQWIADQARRSSLFSSTPVSVIPNGLDTEDFAPRDRAFSRDLWNIPRDSQVILFAAESLDVTRKGFACLVEALRDLKGAERPLLVSVGQWKGQIDLPLPHLNLGKINHDRLLSLAYSAADVFVIPSLQESFGQTVIESLACGTPVVGFASGGIPDMVRPGVTGWLAPTGDIPALREAIATALRDVEGRQRMASEARRIAVSEYGLEAQALAFARLYEQMCAAPRGAAVLQNPVSASLPEPNPLNAR